MRLRPEQLAHQLQSELSSVFVISGDEALLVEEAADQVRSAARQQGFSERDVWHADGRFDWQQIDKADATLSLFASKKLIEIRLPGAAPGKEGGEWFRQFAEQASPDSMLLLISGKLDGKQQKAKWYQALDKAGITVPVWPVDIEHLPRWIQQRLQSRNLQAGPAVATLLAQRLEGNLFAAAQEIDKLALLSADGVIDEQLVLGSVADSSRFEAFGLMDVVQQGLTGKIPRVLAGLRAEGIEVMAIFSAVSWSVQRLADMAQQLASGQSSQQVFSQMRPPVWDNMRPQTLQTIKRHPPRRWLMFVSQLAEIDKAAKGHKESDDAWRLLERLCLQMAAVKVLEKVS
ncbi:MAG: DNA polymerase III subunit delta [Methylophaga sp.]|nr:DNA polymerase III subunit delta [Methylophaga sp.]